MKKRNYRRIYLARFLVAVLVVALFFWLCGFRGREFWVAFLTAVIACAVTGIYTAIFKYRQQR